MGNYRVCDGCDNHDVSPICEEAERQVADNRGYCLDGCHKGQSVVMTRLTIAPKTNVGEIIPKSISLSAQDSPR